MQLVSVLERTVTIEFSPEELFALGEALGEATGQGDGQRRSQAAERAHLMLLDAWRAAFRGLAMAGASCSYVPVSRDETYSLALVEQEVAERRPRRRVA